MEQVNLVGSVASIVTVVSFTPQVVKAWRSRSVNDISYGMVLLLLLSAALWSFYGALIHDRIIIITNLGVGLLNVAILTAKIRFQRAS